LVYYCLLPAINFSVRIQRPKGRTKEEALKVAQTHVDSKMSQEKQLKKEMRKEKARRSKRKDKKKNKSKRDSSSSSKASSSSDSTCVSDSSSDSSSALVDYSSSSMDFLEEVKKKNRTRRSTDKKGINKKVEDLESKFKKLTLNLAKTRPARQPIPLKRAYVWCSNFGGARSLPA
jgi:hypothetical protein